MTDEEMEKKEAKLIDALTSLITALTKFVKAKTPC